MKDKFYVIEIIGANEQVGFVVPRPNGFEICIGGIHVDIGKFKTWELANRFAKKNNLYNKGASVHIRDNEYLMTYYKGSALSTIDQLWYLENEIGEKLFYDSVKEGYYWDTPDVGFLCWESEDEIKGFVERIDFTYKVFIKKFNKDDNQLNKK